MGMAQRTGGLELQDRGSGVGATMQTRSQLAGRIAIKVDTATAWDDGLSDHPFGKAISPTTLGR